MNHQLRMLVELKLPAQLLSFFMSQSDISIYVRKYSRDRTAFLTKKRKKHPSQGDDASTAGAIPGRFGRDEHGDARRANTIPNGGHLLELRCLLLKTLSKADFLIAETAWQRTLCVYLNGLEFHISSNRNVVSGSTLLRSTSISYI